MVVLIRLPLVVTRRHRLLPLLLLKRQNLSLQIRLDMPAHRRYRFPLVVFVLRRVTPLASKVLQQLCLPLWFAYNNWEAVVHEAFLVSELLCH